MRKVLLILWIVASILTPALAQGGKVESIEPSKPREVSPNERVLREKFKTIREFEQAGNELLAAAEPQLAIKQFLLARQASIEDGEEISGIGLKGLAEAYLQIGDINNAIKAFRQLIYIRPDQRWQSSEGREAPVLVKFSQLLMQIGEIKESLVIFNRAVDLADKEIKPYLKKSEGFFNPNAYSFSNSLILAYYFIHRLGSEKKAEVELTRALQADSKSLIVRQMLAETLMAQRKFKEAKKHFEFLAISSDPKMVKEAISSLSGLRQVK